MGGKAFGNGLNHNILLRGINVEYLFCVFGKYMSVTDSRRNHDTAGQRSGAN